MPSQKRWLALVDPFNPEDGLQVRLHDLVVAPGASLEVLEEHDVQVVVPQHEDPLGRQVLTIRSSGMMASLVSKGGLTAEAHHHWVEQDADDPDLGVTKQATITQCALLPKSSSSFAWFDSDPQAWQGGLQAEIQEMNSAITPVVTLATTVQNRPVLAVQVGALSNPNAQNIPTVYVVGTHHAREWISEEVTMRLLRWARSSALGSGDAQLQSLLQTRALVFVPVVNPLQPRFHIYRRLFGDTEFPILKETTTASPLGLPLLRPYQADQSNNVLYTVSGEFSAFAQYGAPRPMLSVTPELTSNQVHFYIECESNPEAIVSAVVEQQKTLLKRLLSHADALLSTSDATNFAAQNFGRVATGGLSREVSPSQDTQTARPALLTNLWKPFDTGPVPQALVNGVSIPMQKGRPGVHYNTYRTDFRDLNPSDPYCLPCFVGVRFPGQSSGVAFACPGNATCVDLKNPGRLPRTPGWTLVSGRRPSTSTNPADIDYWWEVTGSNQDEILTIPTWTPPTPVANCMLSFSTEWNGQPFSSSTLLLERKDGGVWNVVTQWSLDTPFYESRRDIPRLRSYHFEANAQLPSRTPEFRFRLPANRTSSIKIFEPVVLCRTGGMP